MKYPKIDILVPTGRFQALREIVPDNLEEEIKTYSVFESDNRESAISSQKTILFLMFTTQKAKLKLGTTRIFAGLFQCKGEK